MSFCDSTNFIPATSPGSVNGTPHYGGERLVEGEHCYVAIAGDHSLSIPSFGILFLQSVTIAEYHLVLLMNMPMVWIATRRLRECVRSSVLLEISFFFIVHLSK
jgi:hypothetical protein